MIVTNKNWNKMFRSQIHSNVFHLLLVKERKCIRFSCELSLKTFAQIWILVWQSYKKRSSLVWTFTFLYFVFQNEWSFSQQFHLMFPSISLENSEFSLNCFSRDLSKMRRTHEASNKFTFEGCSVHPRASDENIITVALCAQGWFVDTISAAECDIYRCDSITRAAAVVRKHSKCMLRSSVHYPIVWQSVLRNKNNWNGRSGCNTNKIFTTLSCEGCAMDRFCRLWFWYSAQ